MTDGAFIHEHPEFGDLLSIVSVRRGIPESLVEKDYWVTHVLWALEAGGLEIHFKGGTSLSKGFGLIERFSEDLDVKIQADDLPRVRSWTSRGTRATEARRAYFQALGERLVVPGADVAELSELGDPMWRSAAFAVRYPTRAGDGLPEGIRPFVQLEVGAARVTPAVDRAITSWIHDHLTAESPAVASAMRDNRASRIRCVRPEVTLLEKIEAIARRYRRRPFDPPSFVRHYEDAARILAVAELMNLRELLEEMRDSGDIREWPGPDDPSVDPPADGERWGRLEAAWLALEPLYWGARVPLPDCALGIRRLLLELSA